MKCPTESYIDKRGILMQRCPKCGSDYVVGLEAHPIKRIVYCRSCHNYICKWQQAEIAKLKGMLENLVDKLKEVNNSKEYQSVWTLYKSHGFIYNGPVYDKELLDAESYFTEKEI